MSTIRDPAVITNAGRQMMTAGGDIAYTKATLYGQDISHLTKDQLESLTSIGNPLMTVPVGISDKNNAGANTTVVLEATFQNTDLKADLPYTAVGFFAKRGDDAEKLVILGVANAGACLAATSPDGIATDALDIKVAIAIGDATNVTAVIDPAGSVTPATLNSAISKTTHDLTAKIDTKADKTDVNNLQNKVTSQEIEITALRGGEEPLKANREIGNRNYLLNSKDFSSNWITGPSVHIESQTFLGGTIIKFDNNGNGPNALTQVFTDCIPGILTWSVWAKADNSGDTLHTELFGGGGLTDQKLNQGWQKYIFHGAMNPSRYQIYFWGNSTNKGPVYIALPNLKSGMIITDWTPAPEDFQTQIDDLKSHLGK